jgi:hypothetical protein
LQILIIRNPTRNAHVSARENALAFFSWERKLRAKAGDNAAACFTEIFFNWEALSAERARSFMSSFCKRNIVKLDATVRETEPAEILMDLEYPNMIQKL